MKAPLLILGSAALLAGCSPKLLRHYDTLSRTDAIRTIELSAFLTNPKASEKPPIINGLGERAQAELIRSLAAKVAATGGGEDLLTLIQKDPEDPPKACSWSVKNSSSKRIVLTVLGDLMKPADRIDKLDIKLSFAWPTDTNGRPAERATFSSWDLFESVYGKYDIGTAKFTQSTKLTAGKDKTATDKLPTDAGSVVKVLSFGAEADTSLEESASYALRRLSVGGALSGAEARLMQEGGPNVNLFGSSAATLSLKLMTNQNPRGVYAFVLKKQAKNVNPSEVSVERCLDTYPIDLHDILVNVSGSALVREAGKGDGTVSEGDDAATLRWVPLQTTRMVLVPEDELMAKRFGLALCSPRDILANCARLHIEHNGLSPGNAEQVLLPSMDRAIALRAWIVEQIKSQPVNAIGGLTIGTAQRNNGKPTTVSDLQPLTPAQAARLRVVVLAENSTPL